MEQFLLVLSRPSMAARLSSAKSKLVGTGIGYPAT
jgi:hypothetical protein